MTRLACITEYEVKPLLSNKGSGKSFTMLYEVFIISILLSISLCKVMFISLYSMVLYSILWLFIIVLYSLYYQKFYITIVRKAIL